MRKLVLAAVFAAGMTAPAWAYDWEGWYAGLNAGFIDHTASWTDTDYDWFGGTLEFQEFDFIGGGQIGHNWVDGSGVLGIVADINWIDYDDTVGYDCSGGVSCDVAITNEWSWLATLRGKAGISTGNSFLLYLTGGLALGNVDYQWIEDGDPTDSWPSFGDTEWGYVAGGGADIAVGEQTTLGFEVLYVRLGEESSTNEDGFEMEVISDGVIVRGTLNWYFDEM